MPDSSLRTKLQKGWGGRGGKKEADSQATEIPLEEAPPIPRHIAEYAIIGAATKADQKGYEEGFKAGEASAKPKGAGARIRRGFLAPFLGYEDGEAPDWSRAPRLLQRHDRATNPDLVERGEDFVLLVGRGLLAKGAAYLRTKVRLKNRGISRR